MAEDLCISNGSKAEKYQTLLPQIKSLIEGENDLIANLANISAALKETFGFFWVGFYLVKGEELVLGPFQGPIACTRIRKGRGRDVGGARCRCIPRTYSLQFVVALGDRCSVDS